MKIIPAIDLINGQCVRLYQGDFSKATQVADDPQSQLQRFIDDGAEMIHIVDLDGARAGQPVQQELIHRLCALSTVPIEVGGGIRDIETVKRYVDMGVSRIVLGTAAIEDSSFLQKALDTYGDYIAIGIDAKDGKVATRGWENVTETDFITFTQQMESQGAKTIIFTDISKDGTMKGPSLEAYKQLKRAVTAQIVASGGIRSMEDLQALSDIGITEAIVGKAIYEGRVMLGGRRL
ncbi:MAG: 1-(5-phosphoribosyl)-5-[(5-phosphoribosylamino)methylideneamino]imidazole-4-carboxamide isomerase [Tuberibacillus sp.]